MIRTFLAIMISLLLISGCGQPKEMPEENRMPEDMPADFNFSVSYGYGEESRNEINTYERTITKDLIMKGAVTANFTFGEAEMQSIYEKMIEINILGTKELSGQSNCYMTPSNTDSWTVTVDGETKTFSWTDGNCKLSKDATQLLELRTYIQQIVESKEEYKALPAAEGGYD